MRFLKTPQQNEMEVAKRRVGEREKMRRSLRGRNGIVTKKRDDKRIEAAVVV